MEASAVRKAVNSRALRTAIGLPVRSISVMTPLGAVLSLSVFDFEVETELESVARLWTEGVFSLEADGDNELVLLIPDEVVFPLSTEDVVDVDVSFRPSTLDDKEARGDFPLFSLSGSFTVLIETTLTPSISPVLAGINSEVTPALFMTVLSG